jgi:hypothetical protein
MLHIAAPAANSFDIVTPSVRGFITPFINWNVLMLDIIENIGEYLVIERTMT